MFGIGLIICAVMFVGMLAVGGPHHIVNIHDHFRKAAQTDQDHGKIHEGQQQAIPGSHDHVRTDTGGRDEDKENREP